MASRRSSLLITLAACGRPSWRGPRLTVGVPAAGASMMPLDELPITAAGTPTVNLGPRQDGRPQAASVINSEERRDAIEAAIRKALDPKVRQSVASGSLPFGRPGDAAGAMVRHLRDADLAMLLKKKFRDLAPE